MKPLLAFEGFTAKQGGSADHTARIQANDGTLRLTVPEGIEYSGTYPHVFFSEEHTRDTWSVNCAAADTRAAMRGTADPDQNADTSHSVLKSASTVTVWGDEEPADAQQ